MASTDTPRPGGVSKAAQMPQTAMSSTSNSLFLRLKRRRIIVLSCVPDIQDLTISLLASIDNNDDFVVDAGGHSANVFSSH